MRTDQSRSEGRRRKEETRARARNFSYARGSRKQRVWVEHHPCWSWAGESWVKPIDAIHWTNWEQSKKGIHLSFGKTLPVEWHMRSRLVVLSAYLSRMLDRSSWYLSRMLDRSDWLSQHLSRMLDRSDWLSQHLSRMLDRSDDTCPECWTGRQVRLSDFSGQKDLGFYPLNIE